MSGLIAVLQASRSRKNQGQQIPGKDNRPRQVVRQHMQGKFAQSFPIQV
jgi:hypothetical protein